MNLLVLEPEDRVAPGRALVRGRRLEHVRSVHRSREGDSLRVGELGGQLGQAQIVRLSDEALELSYSLDSPPPAPAPVTVLLALPRPKKLRRILRSLTALGVKRIVLMNSYRVEKSFWQSPLLRPEAVREQLLLGLEQARDTILPEVIREPLFRPFVEDRLPALAQGCRRLVAHPLGEVACPRALSEPQVLAVGPEGGFIPYEISRFQEYGFEAVHLGPRVLCVETAIMTLMGRLLV